MNLYVESLLDLLEPLGGVTARRMFGGYGIYKEGLMFGLVADERFYLRTDELSVEKFLERGCEPFVYEDRRGRPVQMKYYEVPESAFVNAQKMKPWALLAWEAALRAPPLPPRKRRGKSSQQNT